MTTPSPKNRLRQTAFSPLHLVLVNPEIPQNTGNIARLCAATGAHLHLVGHLGFSLDEKAVRRAGLDYWPLVKVATYPDFDQFLEQVNPSEVILFSSRATRTYIEAPFKAAAALVFGAESVGLPQNLLDRYANRQFGIPTLTTSVRSLNLANSVAICAYKALEVTNGFDGCRLAK